MPPKSFQYIRPRSIEQAVKALEEHGEGAKVLAGGQSLIPLMKLRLATPEVLVDIGHIKGLSFIKEVGGALRIGATTRHRDVELSPLARERYPILVDTAEVLGDPEVRNMGTIGGAVSHADPAGDWGATFLAFDTKVVVRGPMGNRTIPIDEFFRDTFTTALGPAEVLEEIQVPKPTPRSGGAYMKLKRKTGDFATVGAATNVELAPEGTIAAVRIGLTAVGPTPKRALRAETYLIGREPTPEALAEAGRLAAEDANPTADLRGSEDYKRAMVKVYTQRALAAAVERARR